MGNPGGPAQRAGLKEGGVAVERAKTAGAKTQRERDYIAAVELVYQDAENVPHKTRVTAYEKAMEQLSTRYPDDREAAIFYALALNMTLNPNDKTYANQLKAAGILEKAFAEQPNHPGVAHYLIHSYDFRPLPRRGCPRPSSTPPSPRPRPTRCTCPRTSSPASAPGRTRSIRTAPRHAQRQRRSSRTPRGSGRTRGCTPMTT
jgi:hypothetical protein